MYYIYIKYVSLINTLEFCVTINRANFISLELLFFVMLGLSVNILNKIYFR